ncbi:MAG: hypothetical protein BWY17_05149 [Deltaproteobacteria bacterium ADurb.Bin207]|nr:MAG: hypothetical protein BWY17_05149 [Deltaproteobacteria bacterium ADurb.Bin207]
MASQGAPKVFPGPTWSVAAKAVEPVSKGSTTKEILVRDDTKRMQLPFVEIVSL